MLKVGFDMDGVLLENPLKMTRPVLRYVRSALIGKKTTGSFVPRTPFESIINKVFISSSLFTAKGINDIYKLIDEGVITAYIVTARHSTLKKGYESWIKKLNKRKHFKECFFNKDDEEPYEFKIKLIKDLDLDIFVEDNWDVVQNLNKKTDAKIYWISNFLDRAIPYKYKYNNLLSVVKDIEKMVREIS